MSRHASGLRAWAVQRISAFYLGFYFVYLIGLLLLAPPVSYEAWQSWVSDPFCGVGLLLFFVSLLIHAWVGMRDVMIDYIPIFPARLTLLTATALGLIACGLWAARVIFLAGTAA